MKSFPFRTVEIDERDMKPLRSFDGGPAFDIQLSPDEKSLYTASFLSGEIRRFDADSLRLEAVLPAPLQCRRIAFSPDGGLLFAASYVSGEVQVYDTRDNRAIQSFYVGRRLEGLDAQGNGLYVLSAEGLFRIPLDALGPGGRQGGNQAASP
jgi:sugar lactone lactonase YvrE